MKSSYRIISCLGLAAMLLAAGCSRPQPPDTSIDDAVKGWSCLFNAHDDVDPFDPMPASPPPAFATFLQNHKAVFDGARAYVAKEVADHTPPSPPHEFLDIWEIVQGAAVYESPAGLHAIRYEVRIKEKDTDWDGTYLLLYDNADKLTNVMFTRHPHPSRGFG